MNIVLAVVRSKEL